MILHIKGLGFNSHKRKLSSFFFIVLILLFCFFFCFVFFPNILPLGWFQFIHITSPHHSFVRCCDKRISSIILNKNKCTPAKGVFDVTPFPLIKELNFDTRIAQNVKSPWVYPTSLPLGLINIDWCMRNEVCYAFTRGGGGGTLGILGWGCAAGSLEPLAYTRAYSSEYATLY